MDRVRVPKAGELVASQLRRQIVRGDLREGDALPSEAVLMERFGVSRPTLREAFRILEAENLISVRRGAAAGRACTCPDVAAAARYAGAILEYRQATLSDVFDTRTVLESQAAALLSQRRGRAHLDRLERAARGRGGVARRRRGDASSRPTKPSISAWSSSPATRHSICSSGCSTPSSRRRRRLRRAGTRSPATSCRCVQRTHRSHVKLVEVLRTEQPERPRLTGASICSPQRGSCSRTSPRRPFSTSCPRREPASPRRPFSLSRRG